jgi:hypothetical protein
MESIWRYKMIRSEKFEKQFNETKFTEIQIDLERHGNEIMTVVIGDERPELTWHHTNEYKIVAGNSIIYTQDIITHEINDYICHLIIGKEGTVI